MARPSQLISVLCGRQHAPPAYVVRTNVDAGAALVKRARVLMITPTPLWLLASFCLGFGVSHASRATHTASAAMPGAQPAVPEALKGRGCRLGNSVVPQPSGPGAATICERPSEVMQGFLMQGPERIAICCPVPPK